MFAIAAHSLPPTPAAWLQVLVMVSLKATMLLAAAGLLTLALSRASAAARHLVWSVALASVLALPPLALWGPGFSVRGLGIPAIVTSEARGAAPAPAGPAVGLAKLVAPDLGFRLPRPARPPRPIRRAPRLRVGRRRPRAPRRPSVSTGKPRCSRPGPPEPRRCLWCCCSARSRWRASPGAPAASPTPSGSSSGRAPPRRSACGVRSSC